MTFTERMTAYNDGLAAKQAVIDSLRAAADSLNAAAQNAKDSGDYGSATALFNASRDANQTIIDLVQTPDPPPPAPPAPSLDEEGEAVAQGPTPSGNQPGNQPDSGQPPPSDPPPSDPPSGDPPSGDPTATPAPDGGDDRDTGGHSPPGQAGLPGQFGGLLGQRGAPPKAPDQPGDPSPDAESSPHAGPGQPGMGTPPGGGFTDPSPEAEAGGPRLAGQLAVSQPGAGFTDPSPVAVVDASTRELDYQVREANVKLNGFRALLSKATGHQSR